MKKDGRENKMVKGPVSNKVKDYTHKRGDRNGGKKNALGR